MLRIRNPLAEIANAALYEFQFRHNLVKWLAAKPSRGVDPSALSILPDGIHPLNVNPFALFVVDVESAMQRRVIACRTFHNQLRQLLCGTVVHRLRMYRICFGIALFDSRNFFLSKFLWDEGHNVSAGFRGEGSWASIKFHNLI